jgi:hypothetical protein
MTWIDFLWPMVTGACLTLALINLRLGIAGLMRAAHLFFSLNAIAVVIICGIGLAQLQTENPAQYAVLIFWVAPATWLLLASMDPVMEWETRAVPALKEQPAEADRWNP